MTSDTGQDRTTGQDERDETPSERADRNFIELVQEVRVAQIGVQILFGFFLVLAFYDTFPDESPFPQVLTVALLTTATAALCFMTPVVGHRLHFREGAKERLVWMTHRVTLLGMGAMAVAMVLGVWLVLAHVWTVTFATAVCTAITAVILGLWVAWPWWELRRQRAE